MLDISFHGNVAVLESILFLFSCGSEQEEPESLWASASRYKHRSHRRQTVRSTDLRQTEPKDLQKHCMKLEQESSQRSYNWLINRQSESTDRLMSFNTLRRAVSVLCWALKPDWNAWLIFYWEIGEHRWIWTVESRIQIRGPAFDAYLNPLTTRIEGIQVYRLIKWDFVHPDYSWFHMTTLYVQIQQWLWWCKPEVLKIL